MEHDNNTGFGHFLRWMRFYVCWYYCFNLLALYHSLCCSWRIPVTRHLRMTFILFSVCQFQPILLWSARLPPPLAIHVTADILSTVCAAFSPASSSKYHREQHASSALLFTFLFLLKTFLENRSSAVKWFLYNKWLTEMKYFNRCCNF